MLTTEAQRTLLLGGSKQHLSAVSVVVLLSQSRPLCFGLGTVAICWKANHSTEDLEDRRQPRAASAYGGFALG